MLLQASPPEQINLEGVLEQQGKEQIIMGSSLESAMMSVRSHDAMLAGDAHGDGGVGGGVSGGGPAGHLALQLQLPLSSSSDSGHHNTDPNGEGGEEISLGITLQ